MTAPDWLIWRDERKPNAKECGVDLGGDNLPELNGKHEVMEAQVKSGEKETEGLDGMINEDAYLNGGTWFMDRWLPAVNFHSALKINNTDDKRFFSVAKLQMTN